METWIDNSDRDPKHMVGLPPKGHISLGEETADMKCDECNGTGVVETTYQDSDGNWVPDGEQKCVCQLEN